MFSSNATQASNPLYIENVFSTYLYTGNGTTQTITNGIDLVGKDGMVWIKNRLTAVTDNCVSDTVRGGTSRMLRTNSTAAQTGSGSNLTFLSTGFTCDTAGTNTNYTGETYGSWTFRKQAKFFDIVTWTGSGANRTIAHSLGSVPGCIIVKRTDTTADWAVYHTSLANTEYLVLNTTAAKATGATWWNSTTPTSAVFSVGTDASVNASSGTYVAYVFAHNAGGFGLTGADNVISCGSYTGDGAAAGQQITLGYEAQWVLWKPTDVAANWNTYDTMRGWNVGGNDWYLFPNTTNAESDLENGSPNATGMLMLGNNSNVSGRNYIYIAIRRGPMAVPTLGTSVFGLSASTGTGANATVTGGQTDDAVLIKNRGSAVASLFSSRLTGTGYLVTSDTAAEVAAGVTILQANPWDVMDGVKVGTTSTITNASANTYINYLFRRSPSFFDEACYAGTGSNTTITHNLGAVPELIIVKGRSGVTAWQVYSSALANTEYLVLNTTAAKATGATRWNSTTPTSSVFSIGTATETNTSAATYVAYLFATCTGVSKVGSYTGTGATQTIACGFGASGARFVLIKRTDTTGDWYVWDSARGMISGTDPSLLLNSTAAEVNANSVYAISTGFQIVSTAAGINASAGAYSFLAIA